MVPDRPLKVPLNKNTNLVEIEFCHMRSCASWEERENRLSKITNVTILGKTRELKGKLPKIISEQKI